jgi:hypothetical protein
MGSVRLRKDFEATGVRLDAARRQRQGSRPGGPGGTSPGVPVQSPLGLRGRDQIRV